MHDFLVRIAGGETALALSDPITWVLAAVACCILAPLCVLFVMRDDEAKQRRTAAIITAAVALICGSAVVVANMRGKADVLRAAVRTGDYDVSVSATSLDVTAGGLPFDTVLLGKHVTMQRPLYDVSIPLFRVEAVSAALVRERLLSSAKANSFLARTEDNQR